jgi:hypothetical protein
LTKLERLVIVRFKIVILTVLVRVEAYTFREKVLDNFITGSLELCLPQILLVGTSEALELVVIRSSRVRYRGIVLAIREARDHVTLMHSQCRGSALLSSNTAQRVSNMHMYMRRSHD